MSIIFLFLRDILYFKKDIYMKWLSLLLALFTQHLFVEEIDRSLPHNFSINNQYDPYIVLLIQVTYC